jgi:hypothetical protein
VPRVRPAHKVRLDLPARKDNRDCKVQAGRPELRVRLVRRVQPVHKVRLVRLALLVLLDRSARKVPLEPEVIKDHPEFKAYRGFQAPKAL